MNFEEPGMRTIVIAATLWLSAVNAYAQIRVETTSMTCAQIQAVLDRHGTAILRYRSASNPSLPLYGNYVKDVRSCGAGQTAGPASVPAADTGRCRVQRCMRNTSRSR
jgi:hypothetical protein